jgi:hypothetical protein
MPEPPPPGELGYDPDRWFQHVIYTGLGIARKTGLGLSLFNGLRQRFGGVAAGILGAAATLIGRGVRAANAWMNADAGYVVPLDTLPLAPKGFFGPEEVDRIVGLAERRGTHTDDNSGAYDAERLNFPEDWSKAAVEEVSAEIHDEHVGESPDMIRLVEWKEGLVMNWLGKKY